ncbi:MAG: hypothetical protein NTW21_33035 [Verrucomicrobia bacterium]|nr:hypothetical protein [Verrucomicrobiota bacterium]
MRVVEKTKARAPTTSEEITILTQKVGQDGKKEHIEYLAHQSAWLFGSDNTDLAFASFLVFSEARVLAFPIRSACATSLHLQRATSEALAFLSFLKRFTTKEENEL